MNHHDAVGSRVHVQLDPVRAGGERGGEGRAGVLLQHGAACRDARCGVATLASSQDERGGDRRDSAILPPPPVRSANLNIAIRSAASNAWTA